MLPVTVQNINITNVIPFDRNFKQKQQQQQKNRFVIG